jgi:hypothetical protein
VCCVASCFLLAFAVLPSSLLALTPPSPPSHPQCHPSLATFPVCLSRSYPNRPSTNPHPHHLRVATMLASTAVARCWVLMDRHWGDHRTVTSHLHLGSDMGWADSMMMCSTHPHSPHHSNHPCTQGSHSGPSCVRWRETGMSGDRTSLFDGCVLCRMKMQREVGRRESGVLVG